MNKYTRKDGCVLFIEPGKVGGVVSAYFLSPSVFKDRGVIVKGLWKISEEINQPKLWIHPPNGAWATNKDIDKGYKGNYPNFANSISSIPVTKDLPKPILDELVSWSI